MGKTRSSPQMRRPVSAGRRGRLRPWREISALLLMLIDLSWVAPLSAWLLAGGRDFAWQFAAVPAFLLVGSYLLARGLQTLRIRRSIRRASLIFFMTSGAALALRAAYIDAPALAATPDKAPAALLSAALMLILGVAALTLRGVDLAQRWIGPRIVHASFKAGAVAMFLLALPLAVHDPRALRVQTALFLASSLLASGTARAATQGFARGGRTSPFSLRWMFELGLSAFLLLGISLFAGTAASNSVAEAAALLLLYSVRLIIVLSLLALSPLVLMVSLLLPWAAARIGTSPILAEMQREFIRLFQFALDVIIETSRLLQSLWALLPRLRFLIPVLLAGLILVAIVLIVRWAGRPWSVVRSPRPGRDERGPLASDWDLRRALRRAGGTLVEHFVQMMQSRPRAKAARIRRIYADLIHLSARLGSPRPEEETPLEFLPTLRNCFPDGERDLEAITDAYNRARYGELPQSEAEMQALERAWDRLRAQGEKLVRIASRCAEGAARSA